MNTYRINEKEAEKFFPTVLQGYSTLLPKTITDQLSTENVKVICAFLGNKHESTAGTLIGYAKVANPIISASEQIQAETSYIKFFYKICNSYDTYRITNNMQSIEAAFPILDCVPDVGYRNWFKAQHLLDGNPWGSKGFWIHTPTNTLSGDDLDCRLFIQQVQKVSREQQWGQQLKKLFQQWEKENVKETQTVITIR